MMNFASNFAFLINVLQSSLVRLTVCRYALNEFAEAHAGLEEALACAKMRQSATLEGRLQVAEIMNNLGCLAYMSGQPTTASTYYRDSMDIQFGVVCVLGPIWVQLRDHVGITSGSFWDRVGATLRTISGSLRGHVGIMWG